MFIYKLILAFGVMIISEWKTTVMACYPGFSSTCCSPSLPTCSNPCPQTYTNSLSASYGSYGDKEISEIIDNSYGGESPYGGSSSYGSKGGYGNRPIDYSGNYNNYGGPSSIENKGPYGPSMPSQPSNYGSYGNSLSKTLLPGSLPYGQGPLPIGIQSVPYSTNNGYIAPGANNGYIAPGANNYIAPGPNNYISSLRGNMPGIPYSNALKPYASLASIEGLEYGNGGLPSGYLGNGESSVYSLPPYSPTNGNLPFSSRSRKAKQQAAPKKNIVTLTTMTADSTSQTLDKAKKLASKKNV